MPASLRPLLILLLVLLPLRGWAQASMAVGDCSARASVQVVQAHAHHDADDRAAMDGMAMQSCHGAAGASADCGSHDHLHCVICHLAVGQPPAFALLIASDTQHACPQAADTAWRSADPRALQRPPRA
jgi:hypothetical protein